MGTGEKEDRKGTKESDYIISWIHEKMKYASDKTGRPLKHSKEIEYAHEHMVQHTRPCGKKTCSFVINWLTVLQSFVSCVNFIARTKLIPLEFSWRLCFQRTGFQLQGYVCSAFLLENDSVCMILHFLSVYIVFTIWFIFAV